MPIAKKVIVVCPTSLVSNWDNELTKWLHGRVRTVPICDSTRDVAIADMQRFAAEKSRDQVLIISYETFRAHCTHVCKDHACHLLICDEAHRLKNDETLTNKALASLPCRRRVLLSGTPMQNDLEE